jgi:membrane protease YdiL (CAAX protease family)
MAKQTEAASAPWNPREVVLFFGLAYGISWILWLPLVLGKGGLGITATQIPLVYSFVGTFGPTIAALISQRVFAGNWKAVRFWTSLPEFAIGAVAGAAPMLLGMFVAAAWTTQSGYSLWNWRALLQVLVLFVPNLLGGPLGEEPGWRGFALPRLQSRLSPLTSAVVLGLIWANWHLPLFLVHFTSMAYWKYVILLMAMSIVIAFGFNKSGGSVAVGVLLHGLMNVGFLLILGDLLEKATIRKTPSRHDVIWMTFVGVALLLSAVTKGQLGFSSRGSCGRTVELWRDVAIDG